MKKCVNLYLFLFIETFLRQRFLVLRRLLVKMSNSVTMWWFEGLFGILGDCS